MTLFSDAFCPRDGTKLEIYNYMVDRCCDIKRSLIVAEKDSEHITFTCPLSRDSLEVVGEEAELEWLYNLLVRTQWIRVMPL